jgi:hypothetical protein
VVTLAAGGLLTGLQLSVHFGRVKRGQ